MCLTWYETFDNVSESFGLKLNDDLLSVSTPDTVNDIMSIAQLIVRTDEPVTYKTHDTI